MNAQARTHALRQNAPVRHPVSILASALSVDIPERSEPALRGDGDGSVTEKEPKVCICGRLPNLILAGNRRECICGRIYLITARGVMVAHRMG